MLVNIHTYSMRDEKWFPRRINVPEEKVDVFSKQAYINHSQTIDRLNQRGGLAPIEIYWIWNGHRINGPRDRSAQMAALQLCVDLAAD